MKCENERIEFKKIFAPDIYKEVVAFANTDGGVIYVGIDDEGNRVGLESIDDAYTRITNGIRDAILPDVTMFVKYTLEKDGIARNEKVNSIPHLSSGVYFCTVDIYSFIHTWYL